MENSIKIRFDNEIFQNFKLSQFNYPSFVKVQRQSPEHRFQDKHSAW